MGPKSVTFQRHGHLVSVILEICSAIPTTLHFQCLYLVTVVFDGMKLCI